MKTAILFAGQGSQTVGMGKDIYEEYPEFREVFDLLTEEQKQIAWEGPEQILSDTTNTQPIMLAFGLGVYRILEKAGFRPDMGVGLSLGEYTALAAAGAFSAKEAVDLVTFRAQEMKKAAAGVNPEMIAVMGLSPEEVEKHCRQVSESKDVTGLAEITNRNCPGQIIVSGDAEAVEKASEAVLSVGAKRCIKLNVSGPFHTSYMEPAGEALAERFQVVNWRETEFPILYNYLGDFKGDADSTSELLVKQVSNGVQMESILRRIVDCGVDQVVEIGPGKTLAGFLRKIDRSISCISISTAQDVEQVLSLLQDRQEEA